MESNLVDHHRVAGGSGCLVEYLSHVDHVVAILGNPIRPCWFGTGRDDHVIGLFVGHQARPHGDPVPDLNSESLAFS